MSNNILAALEKRLGATVSKQRVASEEAHTAQVFGWGRNFFHIENFYSAHSIIKNTLRLCLMHQKGQRNAINIQLRHNSIKLEHLHPELQDFTLLHLSDMHLDMDAQATMALMERVREVNYDICVMTGDYRARTYGEIDKAMAAMARLRAQLKKPVYAVLGNHDSITMVPALEEMGIQVLVNENTLIKRGQGTLFLAGIDDAHYFCADDIPKAANGMTESIPGILLSHTPAVYKQAAEVGFDLLLSGHTHGGQICLPGGIPLILDSDCPRFVGKGAWHYHKLQGYTSVGSGTSIVNVRINCLPEITLHTLICKD
ncbi:metallophosphoesterase [Psychromonas ingrahamii 37]|uniref:Metallophosphoesterase n=1 Tax=Psychromonas ingrahamii (strain DSM 17664 / CCUG 51855 / 37) TaxID=357804 RepID=A1SVS8_PSYIN|nr:metallophosphoesterase [Psychromonas ingrahamii]ABM03593.1 metallophosphoesterase [Psychromonas ingrahamii 37]